MDLTPAIILAGGGARRMGGGDKGLLQVGGQPILAHVIERLRPQASPLALAANGDPNRFAAWGLPVLSDGAFASAGPLAGVLAGMSWARGLASSIDAIVSVPTDTPFLPLDFVDRLMAARRETGARVALAASRGRTHFAAALWSLGLADDLERSLAEGLRKVERFAERYDPAVVDFPAAPIDPFLNINSPEDLEEAERLAARTI